MNHPRIQPNGAMCDRCNTALSQYQFNYTDRTEYICPACMTTEERARFDSLNKQEFHA